MPPKNMPKPKPAEDNGIHITPANAWFILSILAHSDLNAAKTDWKAVCKDTNYKNEGTTRTRWNQVRRQLDVDGIAAGNYAVDQDANNNNNNGDNHNDDNDGGKDLALRGGDSLAQAKAKHSPSSGHLKHPKASSSARKRTSSAYKSAKFVEDDEDDEDDQVDDDFVGSAVKKAKTGNGITSKAASSTLPGSTSANSLQISDNDKDGADDSLSSVSRSPARLHGSGMGNWFGSGTGRRLGSNIEGIAIAARRSLAIATQTSSARASGTPSSSTITTSSARTPLGDNPAARPRSNTSTTGTRPGINTSTNTTGPVNRLNTGRRSTIMDRYIDDSNNYSYQGPGRLPNGDIDLHLIPLHPSAIERERLRQEEEEQRQTATAAGNQDDDDDDDDDVVMAGDGGALIAATTRTTTATTTKTATAAATSSTALTAATTAVNTTATTTPAAAVAQGTGNLDTNHAAAAEEVIGTTPTTPVTPVFISAPAAPASAATVSGSTVSGTGGHGGLLGVDVGVRGSGGGASGIAMRDPDNEFSAAERAPSRSSGQGGYGGGYWRN